MKCEDFLPLVEKLADGEVTTAEKREAEAHLKTCEDCREHFQFLEALPNAARQASPSEPPEIYWEALPRKIMARIARMEEHGKPATEGWFFGLFSPSGLRWAGALAAALVAAVVGLQVLDAPFSSRPSSQHLSQDIPQAPSVSSRREDARSGEEGQPVVGGLLESEEEPAGAASSVQSEQALQDQLERSDHSAGIEPARQSQLAQSAQSAQSTQSTPPAAPAAPQTADDSGQALQKARAAADVGEEGLESNEPKPEEDAAFESGPRLEASARPQEARDEASDQVGQAASAPSGARAFRSRPDQEAAEGRIQADAQTVPGLPADEGYRALLERYPLEGGESTAASEAGPDDKVRECSDWRQFVERHGGAEEGMSARYRLALCSIALYDREPSDDNRRQAVEDSESYLAAEPSGDQADAIRRALERIRR